MKTLNTLALILTLVSAATAAEPVRPVTTPSTAVSQPAARTVKVQPAEPKEEFAGFTMLRFFASTVEAVKTDGQKLSVPTGQSIRIAAY